MDISKLPTRCIYCLMYQEKFDIEMKCEDCAVAYVGVKPTKFNASYYEKEEKEEDDK